MVWSDVRRWLAALAMPVAVAAALASPGGGWAAAQEATHPAHIHSGSCDNLGEVVYPLTDVGPNGMAEGMMAATPGAAAASPMAEMGGMAMGATSAIPVETSFTLVDASLADLLGSAYAINVHESQANIGTYIACGDIGGAPMAMPGMAPSDQTLVIGLRELNGSGYAGIAVLRGQGDQTRVILYLAEGLATAGGMGAMEMGTPAATSGATGSTVDVSLTEFAIDMPASLPAGSVTFRVTNNGTIQHSFEFEGQGIEQRLDQPLQPGESATLTIDLAPGSYEAYCPVDGHKDQGMELDVTVG